jgi:hypothetical protein
MCLWCEGNGYRNRAFEHLELCHAFLGQPLSIGRVRALGNGARQEWIDRQVPPFRLLLHRESLPVVLVKDLMLRQAQSSDEPKFGTNSVDSRTPSAVGHLVYRFLHR